MAVVSCYAGHQPVSHNPLAWTAFCDYEAPVLSNGIFGSLALVALALTLWQWLVARRFPLHHRVASLPPPAAETRQPSAPSPSSAPPAVTLLKPLRGSDLSTEASLRSWFTQHYAGPVQILLGVASAEDPVSAIVRKLLHEFPGADAQLVVCGPLDGANAKVCTLTRLQSLAKHELLVISDADVRVPSDLLSNLVALLREPPVPPQADGSPPAAACALVTCFYRLANPSTLAMQWEAVAINADFWSSVLQAQSLKPLDFALGAVMAVRRQLLEEVDGFKALTNCLADDYQLGNRLARRGYRIAISPVVVECWSEPMGWAAVWKHQLRWTRTIRVCQPLPYFFSILNNATLWPLLWLAANPVTPVLAFGLGCGLVRVATACNLQHLLARRRPLLRYAWLPLAKDLAQVALWLLAFLGNRVEWRGRQMHLRRDGTLVEV